MIKLYMDTTHKNINEKRNSMKKNEFFGESASF